VIAVYIPEYITSRWWQNLLHNQSALRIKTRLFFTPGVVVINVPYHLGVDSQGWLGGEPRPDTADRPSSRSSRRMKVQSS
jgi:hypothetical protein